MLFINNICFFTVFKFSFTSSKRYSCLMLLVKQQLLIFIWSETILLKLVIYIFLWLSFEYLQLYLNSKIISMYREWILNWKLKLITKQNTNSLKFPDFCNQKLEISWNWILLTGNKINKIPVQSNYSGYCIKWGIWRLILKM